MKLEAARERGRTRMQSESEINQPASGGPSDGDYSGGVHTQPSDGEVPTPDPCDPLGGNSRSRYDEEKDVPLGTPGSGGHAPPVPWR